MAGGDALGGVKQTELLGAVAPLAAALAAAGWSPSYARNTLIRVRCITEAMTAAVGAELPALRGEERAAVWAIRDAAAAAAAVLTEAHARQSLAQRALLKLRRTDAHALVTGTLVLTAAMRYVATACFCVARRHLALPAERVTETDRATFRKAGAVIALLFLFGCSMAQRRMLCGVHVRPTADPAVLTATHEVDKRGDHGGAPTATTDLPRALSAFVAAYASACNGGVPFAEACARQLPIHGAEPTLSADVVDVFVQLTGERHTSPRAFVSSACASTKRCADEGHRSCASASRCAGWQRPAVRPARAYLSRI